MSGWSLAGGREEPLDMVQSQSTDLSGGTVRYLWYHTYRRLFYESPSVPATRYVIRVTIAWCRDCRPHLPVRCVLCTGCRYRVLYLHCAAVSPAWQLPGTGQSYVNVGTRDARMPGRRIRSPYVRHFDQ